MSAGAEHREWPVWLIWALLAGLSLAGFLLAEGLAPARVAAMLAVALATVKIHLIFDHFMEVAWRNRPLRQLLAVWLGVVAVLLLVTYWYA